MQTNSKDARRFFNITNKANVLTLDMMDAIGADMCGDGITASAVNDAISQAGEFSSVTLNINSPGGDLFDGVAIHNTLKACGKPVNVKVLGVAASAASLIAMAGDTITMCAGSMLMIHRAMAMTAGFSDDMRKMADTLDSVSASAADIYVARTGLTKDAVLALMTAETWMSPEEAVAQGFATSVTNDAKAIKNAFDLSTFHNVPVALKAEAEVIPVVVEPVVVEPDPLIDTLRKRIELARRK